MNIRNRVKHCLLFFYNKHRLKGKVKFPYSAQISHRSEFECCNAVGAHSTFYGKMGYGTYIGNNNHISAYIGRFTSIGSGTRQIVETHPMQSPFATTCPMFFSMKKQNGHTFAKKQKFQEYRFYDENNSIALNIGNDCWVGNNVTFIGGVSLSDGAVVLSGAIVTKDIPPYAIVGGVPARIITYRYDKETIDFLIRIKWWNNTPEWFLEHSDLLCDIDDLKRYFN